MARGWVAFRRFSRVSRTNRAGLFPERRAARVNWSFKPSDSQKLAELVATVDGEVYANSAYRSTEAEAMLAQKQVTSHIHERAYRNRPLSDAQKGSHRQKSKIRARIEHLFGFMSQSMKGFYLRYIGRRRNAAAIGLINLIYNLARYEQIVRLKRLPRNPV